MNKYIELRLPLFIIAIFAVLSSVLLNAYSEDKHLESASALDFLPSITEGKEPLTVQFTSEIKQKENINIIWDFGDGTSDTLEKPIHTYNKPGVYSVSLFVKGADGKEEKVVKKSLIQVTKRSRPLADFSALPNSGKCPLVVNFFDESKGHKLSSWMWDFGNGNMSTKQNPVVSFRIPGIYTIKLTVSNSLGAHLLRKTNYIHVKDDFGPTSAFIAEPLITVANKEVTFTSFSSGQIENLLWDFGDGYTSTEQNPKHLYLKEGLFDVKLTVSGNDGSDFLIKKNHIRIIAN